MIWDTVFHCHARVYYKDIFGERGAKLPRSSVGALFAFKIPATFEGAASFFWREAF